MISIGQSSGSVEFKCGLRVIAYSTSKLTEAPVEVSINCWVFLKAVKSALLILVVQYVLSNEGQQGWTVILTVLVGINCTRQFVDSDGQRCML